MYRLFKTHQIRKEIPLPDFWTLQVPEHEAVKIPVPCCVESIPAFSHYKGKCTIDTKQCFAGDLKLTFKGVGHTANVYVDGQHIGSHYGSYGEFSFVLKNQEDGTHTISVEADNSYTEASALHVDNDYYSYLGITRPVILEQLDKEIAPLEIGSWHKPNGGYFVSFNGLEGTAKRTVELCKEAGVVLTGAGATFPYGKDPMDSNIRIAPTYPTVEELQTAIEIFCLAVKLAAIEVLTK